MSASSSWRSELSPLAVAAASLLALAAASRKASWLFLGWFDWYEEPCFAPLAGAGSLLSLRWLGDRHSMRDMTRLLWAAQAAPLLAGAAVAFLFLLVAAALARRNRCLVHPDETWLRLPSRRRWGLLVFTVAVAIVAAGHSYLAYYDEHPFPPEHLTLALLQAATLLYLGLLFGLVGMTLQMFGDNRSDRLH